MWRLRYLILCLGVSLVCLPGIACAQTCNNVIINNLFYGYITVSVTSLSFGAYSPQASSPQQSSVSITATCTGGLLGATLPPFTVSMSTGNGSFTQRQMLSGTNALHYQIYTSASLATIWGDGSGSTSTVSAGNNGASSQTIIGYGVIAANQYVTPGNYTDLITVTVSY